MTSIHRFSFDPRYRLAALAFGVTPSKALVEVGDGKLRARFGPWWLVTTLDNVAEVAETGPYGLLKTMGPGRLSFADRGLTFATNPRRGLCIRFREPVPALLPLGLLPHPSLTVTVTDPSALARELAQLGVSAARC